MQTAEQAQPNYQNFRDDDYENMDNREILTKQKQWLKQQDDQID